jgi:hypothetical protein
MSDPTWSSPNPSSHAACDGPSVDAPTVLNAVTPSERSNASLQSSLFPVTPLQSVFRAATNAGISIRDPELQNGPFVQCVTMPTIAPP